MTLLAGAVTDAQRASLLGRTSPLVKLGVAVAWLVALSTAVDVRLGLGLAVVAAAATIGLGGVPLERLVRGAGPLLLAAAGIAVTNLLFSGSNADPAAAEVARLGPLRVTAPAAGAAAALAARVSAIVAVGAAFSLTTDATRLADALVQQARLSPRFAYGALAAYQAVPRLAADLGTLRTARRVRGLPDWHPRILVGLLVRAIRHADQLALAMDARGFGTGPRTTYRPLAWTWRDALIGLVGLGVAVVARLLIA